ncbi:hypothetical protein HY251_11280 [bacterium]|nr:hypothetical protein [bacterium]
MIRAEDYEEIPENRHKISAGTLLLATKKPIVPGGGTSLDFVLQQGGDEDTLIFMLGAREAKGPLGLTVEFLEGIFLTKDGQGFHPTWGFDQLLREVDRGGWQVIPTTEVVVSWSRKVEERMNKGEADGAA